MSWSPGLLCDLGSTAHLISKSRAAVLQAYFLTIPSKFAATTVRDGMFEFWLGYSANFACHGTNPKQPYGQCTSGSNAPDAGYSWVLQKMRLGVGS